jgi:hypothetical protein
MSMRRSAITEVEDIGKLLETENPRGDYVDMRCFELKAGER